ncbi:hypothetical protein [Dongia sp. agr-C8]
MADAAHSAGNHELADEITPAMRRKLRRDARLQSLSAGMLMLSTGIFAPQRPLGDFVQWAVYVNLALAVMLFGCALFYPGYLIEQEVRYRRRHGKWRWER